MATAKDAKAQPAKKKPGAKPGTIPPNAGKGRPKGAQNKATKEFRETVQKLLDDNRENFALWLKQTAEGIPPVVGAGGAILSKGVLPAPDKALMILSSLAEFAAPKQARVEHVGDGGGPLEVAIVRFGELNKADQQTYGG